MAAGNEVKKKKASKVAKKASGKAVKKASLASPQGSNSNLQLNKGFRESKKTKPAELVGDAEHTYSKEQFDFKQCAVGEQKPFTCARCAQIKNSRNKIIFLANMKVICNGCYGCIISPNFKKNTLKA